MPVAKRFTAQRLCSSTLPSTPTPSYVANHMTSSGQLAISKYDMHHFQSEAFKSSRVTL